MIENNKIYKKFGNLVSQINDFENKLIDLSNNELKIKNLNLREQYKKTKNLELLIIESFALTREMTKRKLNLRHFNSQIIAGLALAYGYIIDMKTGEGKTLAAALAANYMFCKNIKTHLITTNDYLAKRDKRAMETVYEGLGIKTGLIQKNMSFSEKQLNYNADITYVTSTVLAFDHLEDTLTKKPNQILIKSLDFCIIDEIDSILIDEISTPLIISEPTEQTKTYFKKIYKVIKKLKPHIHYIINRLDKSCILTTNGIERAKKLLKVKKLYDRKTPWIEYLLNALKIEIFFQKDIDYIVQENKIKLIDEFTGRISEDKQLTYGLQQFIEIKENLNISSKSKTRTLSTFQNFFLQYTNLVGMTGTGKESEKEFQKIFNLSVLEIPKNMSSKRQDNPNLFYLTKTEMYNDVIKLIKQIHQKGQPILVGTRTIQISETIAKLLTKNKLRYRLLNAKVENSESEIIALAGTRGAITIATNMAGRGTDIILGGNLKFYINQTFNDILNLARTTNNPDKKKIKEWFKQKKFLHLPEKFFDILMYLTKQKDFINISKEKLITLLNNSYPSYFYYLKKKLTIVLKNKHIYETQIIKDLGGLYVIGVEKNLSIRIDNQLRGRCSRQGDPGISQFFISLEDELVTEYLNEMSKKVFAYSIKKKSFKTLNYLLLTAQYAAEEKEYQQRQSQFDYNRVIDKQRQIFNNKRSKVLQNKIEKSIEDFLYKFINLKMVILKNKNMSDKDIIDWFQKTLQIKTPIRIKSLKNLKSTLINKVMLRYETILKDIIIATNYARYRDRNNDPYEKAEIEKVVILEIMDNWWSKQINLLESLKESVQWQSYIGIDPLNIYRQEAFYLFNSQKVESLEESVILGILAQEKID
uniref:Protein translocase subunit SecA n=1 Tax=Nitzschia alba TaxID=2858 RepID=A0A5C0F3Q5_NITAL|nr:preprotein translocase subunit A [Nitzschia alba]QEI59591.1 preprotein translocase subunit A [Nitzschia alba]